VHVDFGFVGQIEVEDVRDVLDVDAAAGNVGCHEDEDLSISETFQGSCSCSLTLVSVNGVCRDADLLELLSQTVGAVLRSCEDDTARDHLAFNQVNEQLTLIGFLDKCNVLLDPVGRGRLRVNVHPDRVVKH
jgi:hypothetical protein